MLKFKLINDTKVNILNDKDEVIGHMFTPSGSGKDIENAIQVCGFTDAFDLWGCGVFKGCKDIQLLYDDQKMQGKHIGDKGHFGKVCFACYQSPCQCEDLPNMLTNTPFLVKRQKDLGDRVKVKKK